MDKYGEFMGTADVLIPEKILERPRRRLKAVEALRADILDKTMAVNQKVEEIYTLVKTNMFSAETDEGFLEKDFTEYDDCFFVDI